MTTKKLDLSLRLRHPDADLTPFAQRLGLTPSSNWAKGDPRRTPKDEPLGGARDSSYCSIPLDVAESPDLESALIRALKIISAAQRDLDALVKSGGTASIAIGWFCDGDAGARIPEAVVAAVARLKLTIDIYIYFQPDPGKDAG